MILSPLIYLQKSSRELGECPKRKNVLLIRLLWTGKNIHGKGVVFGFSFVFFFFTKIVKVFGDGFGLFSRGSIFGEKDLGFVQNFVREALEQCLVGHCVYLCHPPEWRMAQGIATGNVKGGARE